MRRRSWWLIALGAIVAVMVTAWVSADEQAFPGRLDPRNPKPDGAQAVARVLEDRGVDVDIARGHEELLATPVETGAGHIALSWTMDLTNEHRGSGEACCRPSARRRRRRRAC